MITATVAVAVAVLAPTVNCIQLLPQLYKTYTTKSVEDLSLQTILLMLLTNILWFTHGLFIRDPALLFSGSVSLFINAALLVLYMLYIKA